MKHLKKIVTIGVFALALALPLFGTPVDTYAQTVIGDACNNSGADSALCNNTDASVGDLVKTVINVLLFIVGIISVIMIIVGGIRFTTSGGNASGVAAGRNTVLYSVIGLIVAFLAYALVNWVIGRF